MAMSQEQSKIFDELFTMFNEQGWKIFQEEVSNQFEVLKETSYLTCEDGNSWQRQRGIMQTLQTILNYEEGVKAQYEQLQNETDDDAETDI